MPSLGRLVSIVAICALLITGCSGSDIRYVESGTSHTKESALKVLEAADSGALSEENVDGARELRHDALVALRKQEDGAAEAADLITKTFGADVAAVPFQVERATYGDVNALLIVEAVGRRGGRLEDKRLWVIGDDGSVLLSANR